MTNEMMRPCLPEGWELKEPFDACDFNMDYFEVFRNESDCNYNVYFLGTKIATVDEYADSFPIYRQIITTIADALKAPVLATEEVLAGLPKDAKVWVVVDEGNRKAQYKATYKYMRYDTDPIWEYTPYDCSVCEDDGYEYPHEVYTDSGCYLVADKDDPKTAEYLRQFTLQGVRRVG
jgi:hypothetical protein